MTKTKYFILFLILWLIYLFTNYFNAERAAFNFWISLDNLIPFIPGFVIFYLLYFPLVLFQFFIIKKEKDFINVAKANIFVIIISNIIFLLLPTKIIRPELIVNDFSGFILSLIYLIDNNVNLFPSLHVSMSLLAFLNIIKFKKNLKFTVLATFILTTLSTLFIKQHYVIDIIGGLILGFISYKIYFKKRGA